MTLKTKKTMHATNNTAMAMSVRHPVGTNHFQFRCHQFPRGGCGVNGGGVGDGFVSIEPLSAWHKNLSREISFAELPFDFLGKLPRNAK
jgi:hypothetical protein